jgi:serralysin
LFGSSVRNLIEGGDGDDYMEGRGGGDRFEGGRGMDTVSYAWASTGVRASLNTSEPQQTNVGLDRFIGVENLRGTAADDVLAGNADANRLFGGGGDDRLIGNAGGDIMYGGAGRDIFVFRPGDSGVGAPGAADHISDFSRFDGDRINLREIDAVVGTGANEAFTFIGTASFSGQAGELRYSGSGATKVVRGDIDGDRIADFAIVVGPVNALDATDFIL